MSANFYQRKGKSAGGLNDLVSDLSPSIKIPSIVDGQDDYKADIRKLSATDITEMCIPSQYNGRRFDRLTRAAVADIFDDIVDSGGNTEIAKGVMINGKIHVLTGLRRMYCVMNAIDTFFTIAVAESMLEEDQIHIARIADIYDEPSIMDFAYSVKAIRDSTKDKNGKPMPFAKIAELKSCSKGKVVEAEQFAALPEYIISPFPGLRFISYAWLRSVTKYNGYFTKAKPKLVALEDGSEKTFDGIAEAEDYSKKLAKKITSILKSFEPKEVSDAEKKWSQFKAKPGLAVKAINQKVSINIDLEKADPKLLTALEKLLKK